jgi:hypothetical protein
VVTSVVFCVDFGDDCQWSRVRNVRRPEIAWPLAIASILLKQLVWRYSVSDSITSVGVVDLDFIHDHGVNPALDSGPSNRKGLVAIHAVYHRKLAFELLLQRQVEIFQRPNGQRPRQCVFEVYDQDIVLANPILLHVVHHVESHE